MTSGVWLCVIPWAIGTRLLCPWDSPGRREYWSGLPCFPLGNLPYPRIEPVSLLSPALAGGFFTASATWEACLNITSSERPSPLGIFKVDFPLRTAQKKESESGSVLSDSLRPHGLYSPCNSPGQNTGVGSLSFLQGIFPTQGSNPGLLHCRQIFFTSWATREAQEYWSE